MAISLVEQQKLKNESNISDLLAEEKLALDEVHLLQSFAKIINHKLGTSRSNGQRLSTAIDRQNPVRFLQRILTVLNPRKWKSLRFAQLCIKPHNFHNGRPTLLGLSSRSDKQNKCKEVVESIRNVLPVVDKLLDCCSASTSNVGQLFVELGDICQELHDLVETGAVSVFDGAVDSYLPDIREGEIFREEQEGESHTNCDFDIREEEIFRPASVKSVKWDISKDALIAAQHFQDCDVDDAEHADTPIAKGGDLALKQTSQEAQQDTEFTVTFQPGPIGLEYEANTVTRAFSFAQACNAGVKVGWRLKAVNGAKCECFESEAFQDAYMGDQPYRITFELTSTDFNNSIHAKDNNKNVVEVQWNF